MRTIKQKHDEYDSNDRHVRDLVNARVVDRRFEKALPSHRSTPKVEEGPLRNMPFIAVIGDTAWLSADTSAHCATYTLVHALR